MAMFNLDKYPEQWIEIAKIDIEGTQFQSREAKDEKKIKALAEELKKDGQLEEVILYRFNDPSKPMAIISGHNRTPAAKSINWEKIRARVIPETDMDLKTAFILSVKENLNCDSLKNKDIIFSCKKMRDNGMTQAEIGQELNIAESTVRKYLAAAASPDAKKVAEGSVPIGQALDNKKMYYKPLGNKGFNLSIKFNIKTDDPQALKDFLDKAVPELYKQIENFAEIKKNAKNEQPKSAGKSIKKAANQEGGKQPANSDENI